MGYKKWGKEISFADLAIRNRLPLDLIYYEACRDKKDSFRREKHLRTSYGRRYLKSLLKNSTHPLFLGARKIISSAEFVSSGVPLTRGNEAIGHGAHSSC
jgi:hypothetical protein